MNCVLAALDDAPGHAVGDQQRHLRRGRQDQRLGRDAERPLGTARPRRPTRAAARSRRGSSSGATTGRPIPKPGIAALPQAAAGSSARVPVGTRRGEVRGDLRVVDREVRAGPEVGRERVGEIGEGQGPADDRDRVTRLDPALAIGPVAAPIPERPAPGSGASGSWTVSSSATASERSISANRVDPLRRMSRPGGSSPAMPVSPSKRTGASNRAPRGKTRMLPDASRTRKPIERSSV